MQRQGAARITAPRFTVNPAARLLWRGPELVQLELGSRAVVVEGADATLVRRLVRRPSAAGPPSAPDEDGSVGGTTLSAAALLALTHAGYLWPGAGDDTDPAPPRPRLAPELGALAARHGTLAAELLDARRHYAVIVHGAGRAAAHIASLLAAAGVGRVQVPDVEPVRLHQAVPGGVGPGDEGAPLAVAAKAAVHRAAPDADTTSLPVGERPDLVVLAIDEPIEPERREALHAHDWSHLPVQLGPDFGAVGPLVIPGLTSCLRCADLHRRDRDPAWSALAVQLSVPPRHGAVSDVALATVIAGVAALQALAYLDGDDPATVEGTLELHQPDWRIRRRSWPAHPDCGCTAGRPG
jgi:hypothetical protein